MLLVLTIFLAAFPKLSFLGLAFILAVELLSKTASKPVKNHSHPVPCLLFFTLYVIQTLYFCESGFPLIVLAFLSASIGLSLSHEIAHRYNLFHLSVYYQVHLDHHGIFDPEKSLRRETIINYTIKKIKLYLASPATLVDGIWFAMFCYAGIPAIITYFASLILIEFIGYVQHDTFGKPIDFKNWGDNALFYNAGFHSAHHKEQAIGEHNSGVLLGMLATIAWIGICFGLYPLLKFSSDKSNTPGMYFFGLFQNVRNYKAANGESITPLFYKSASIWDEPTLLLSYLRIMFRSSLKNIDCQLVPGQARSDYRLDHAVIPMRNIYLKTKKTNDRRIFVYQNKIVDGHHRYSVFPPSELQFIELKPRRRVVSNIFNAFVGRG